jgi:cytochrome c oxidase cbb3-type subunit 1
MGEDGWIFNRSRSFYAWHGSVIGYIAAVTIAGWHEGYDPAFTIVPGTARNVLYAVRLITGILMLLASLDWFVDATNVLREPIVVATNVAQEQIA